MSLVYRDGSVRWAAGLIAVCVSAAAHVAPPVVYLATTARPPDVAREETGVQGAILFDLSDIIAAPSDAGEDSRAVAEAEEAATVTESAEVVDPARAADEPILAQVPYAVDDDELKFAVASPDSAEDVTERAQETATEYNEDQVLEPSALGAVAAMAAQASVSGVEAEAEAETAQARSEGLSAEQLQDISDWQKSVVVRIAKAKQYPQAARKQGIEGEVRVTFTLDRYGAVLAREVETSSGSDLLDQAALAVFDALEKLPTPPGHLAGDSFTLVIPLNYRIRRG
ncbi:energy transducer TonB [Puniceibacterium confluentis]|uniref:energy transducer TonB n=1 Tax=Puniceibacterium confluentis TaxID=1958944 RepID=UPI0011B790D9|nr:TonB family protein [Puniceibacterium confluentis]